MVPFLGGILKQLSRKQIITKKQLHWSLWVYIYVSRERGLLQNYQYPLRCISGIWELVMVSSRGSNSLTDRGPQCTCIEGLVMVAMYRYLGYVEKQLRWYWQQSSRREASIT